MARILIQSLALLYDSVLNRTSHYTASKFSTRYHS